MDETQDARAPVPETCKTGQIGRGGLWPFSATGLWQNHHCGVTQGTVCSRRHSISALSIDDFYLPRSWQEVVAELNQDNPLLQSRGNAGTHDVGLGERTLKALSSSAKAEVPLPRYDKSAEAGKGDRVQSSLWSSQSTPIDVLVLEGWMLGFKPRSDLDALSKIHPSLPAVNEKLSKYEVWDEQIDAWCVIGTENLQQAFKWRLEAEHKMKASGRSGMTDEEVRRFVEIYMPAYAAYSERLFDAASDQGVDGKPSLCFYVGPDRNPLPDL